MNILKKFKDFAVICIFILAVIGVTANLFYYGQPLFAVVSLVMDAFAFPYVKACIQDIME